MAWLAVDADGAAYIYKEKPIRATDVWLSENDESPIEPISNEGIKMIIGKRMKWENEPIEVK